MFPCAGLGYGFFVDISAHHDGHDGPLSFSDERPYGLPERHMPSRILSIGLTDDYFSSLLCDARECARIYLLVSKRRKGCDGMGELAMIKEEFSELVDRLIDYCRAKEYLSGNFDYDLDNVADVLITGQSIQE